MSQEEFSPARGSELFPSATGTKVRWGKDQDSLFASSKVLVHVTCDHVTFRATYPVDGTGLAIDLSY